MSQSGHVEAWLLLVHPDKVPDVALTTSLTYYQSVTAFALLPPIEPNLRESFCDIFTTNGVKLLSNEEDLPESLTTAFSKDKVEIMCIYIKKLYPHLVIFDVIAEAFNQTPLEALLLVLCARGSDPLPKTTHYMLQEGVTNIIEQLVRLGANIRYRSESGTTFLHLAIKKRCESLVQLLVKNGANINAPTGKNETILHFAITHGAPVSMVEFFLGLEVDVNHVGGSNYETPLLLCLKSTRSDVLEVVKTLLENGADVNATSKGESVLKFAVLKGPEFVACVLEHRPDLTSAPNREAVWFAFRNKHEKSIDLILQYGFKPNLEEAGCVSTLYDAISCNRAKVVKQLLKLGQNANLDLNAALRHAVERSGGEVIEVLLDNGVEIQVHVLLPLAVSSGNLKAVKWFLAQGVRMTVGSSSPASEWRIAKLFLTRRNGVMDIPDDDIDGLAVYTRYTRVTSRITGVREDSLNFANLFLGALWSDNPSIAEFFLMFDDPRARILDDGALLEAVILMSGTNTIGKTVLEYGSLSLDAIYSSRVYEFLLKGRRIPRVLPRVLPGDLPQFLGYFDLRAFFISDQAKTATLNAIKQHVSAIIAARLSVNEGTHYPPDYLYDVSSPSNQFKVYEAEVKVMKESKIGDTEVTFYDILNASVPQVVNIVRDVRVVEVLESEDYGEDFLSYKGMISKRFRKAHFRRTLMEEGIEMLRHLCPHHVLPHEVSEKIVDYLSNQDLFILSNLRKKSFAHKFSEPPDTQEPLRSFQTKHPEFNFNVTKNTRKDSVGTALLKKVKRLLGIGQ